MTPPTGYPGSGSPRARDVGRPSHVSKKGRLVTRYVLTKRGPAKRRVRTGTIGTTYRRVFASVPKREGTLGLRKGTQYLIPQERVLEVMVYGLARDKFADRYAFLPEQDWVFHLKAKTDPESAISVILSRLSNAGIVVIDTDEGGYRPFTVAAQVVDAVGTKVLTLDELATATDEAINALEWKDRRKS